MVSKAIKFTIGFLILSLFPAGFLFINASDAAVRSSAGFYSLVVIFSLVAFIVLVQVKIIGK